MTHANESRLQGGAQYVLRLFFSDLKYQSHSVHQFSILTKEMLLNENYARTHSRRDKIKSNSSESSLC